MPEAVPPWRESIDGLRDSLTAAQAAAHTGASDELRRLLESAAAEVERLDRLVQELYDSSFVTTGDPLSGPYRGTVVANVDPLQRGRLQVSVPVLGLTGWAPVVAPLAEAVATTPVPVGAFVWVVFEQGDPDYPVVLGALVDSPRP